MAKIFTFFICILSATLLQAQCPGCIVNPACTANPAAPSLCPETLPDAIQGQPYEIDATFFMPQQFTDPGSGFDVTLASITIATIGGLPPGLSATTNDADNIYEITSDPLTQRGCVRICGIPTAIGFYTISVNVIASVSAPISTFNLGKESHNVLNSKRRGCLVRLDSSIERTKAVSGPISQSVFLSTTE